MMDPMNEDKNFFDALDDEQFFRDVLNAEEEIYYDALGR